VARSRLPVGLFRLDEEFKYCLSLFMTQHHERPKVRRVAEPVQVYLVATDRTRLDRLSGLLGATKSDVLRRGLQSLERELLDPEEHPALRVVGLAEAVSEPEGSYDVAREHDRHLADVEDARSRARRRGA
jgi:hypothetical protein